MDGIERNRLGAVLVVVGHHQPVIINIHAVDESVNDLFLIFQIIGIAVLEPADPRHDLLLGEPGLLLLQDADVQFLAPRFQILQALLCRWGDDTSLDSVQHVLNGLFTLPQLLLQRWKQSAFPVLVSNQRVSNAVDHIIMQHTRDSRSDHGALDPAFLDRLQRASLLPLCAAVLVIVVYLAIATPAAFTCEHPPTMAAEQLRGQ